MKPRVVIADDHVSIRQMLARLLAIEPEPLDVAGEARTGIEAVELCRRLRPDLLILDLGLPEIDGVEVMRRLHSASSDTRVLVYTGTMQQSLKVRALKQRPAGYVEKQDTLATFREALRCVVAGGTFLTAFASMLLADSLTEIEAGLTLREREIVQMIAESRSSKEIAERLGVSARTIEHHRENLMRKLHLRDVAAITRFAIRQGWVE